jgi:two-component system response regulator ChvI
MLIKRCHRRGALNNIHGNNKFILVLDDDSDIVAFIKAALQRQGFKVSAFTDPDIALEDFNKNCKDCSLVLTDIRMPKMNGYEFIKKVKEIKKEVKVILMTAFEIDDKEFHNLLPSIKVDAFLRKPFSINQLSHMINMQIYATYS